MIMHCNMPSRTYMHAGANNSLVIVEPTNRNYYLVYRRCEVEMIYHQT